MISVDLCQIIMLGSESLRIYRGLESGSLPVEVLDLLAGSSHDDGSQGVDLGAYAPVTPVLLHILNDSGLFSEPPLAGECINVSLDLGHILSSF